ncbi:hypothetical protein SMICM304S_00308 [Streptomyces microflavus]
MLHHGRIEMDRAAANLLQHITMPTPGDPRPYSMESEAGQVSCDKDYTQRNACLGQCTVRGRPESQYSPARVEKSVQVRVRIGDVQCGQRKAERGRVCALRRRLSITRRSW